MKTLILLIIALSLTALIHEFGHLITAKMFGVYCPEFSIGMGPLLFQKQYKETKYSLRLFLIGGYVSMAGDGDNDEEDTEKLNIPEERYLRSIHPLKRIVVMYAGIFMNFVLAIFIIGLVLLNAGYYGVSSKPIIKEIIADSPAETSGFEIGDEIQRIELSNGSSINVSNFTEMSAFLELYDGNGPWVISVNRDNEIKKIEVVPNFDETEQRYLMGASFDSYKYKEVNIFNCFYYSCDYLWTMAKLTVNAVLELFKGIGMQNLSGPVGMYTAIDEVSQVGYDYYFILIAMISLSAGIMNAIPIPVMDGGRVVLTIIEMIIRKPINKKIENMLMAASVALLIMLFVFVTYNDVLKLF